MQNQIEIISPQINDVLKGRGVIYNSHHGNVQYRSIVNDLKVDYIHAPKHRKPLYAENIVLKIKSMDPPGRFLKYDKNAGKWEEISDKDAMFKTRQALREGAKDIPKQDVNNSAGGPNGSNRPSVSDSIGTNDTPAVLENITQYPLERDLSFSFLNDSLLHDHQKNDRMTSSATYTATSSNTSITAGTSSTGGLGRSEESSATTARQQEFDDSQFTFSFQEDIERTEDLLPSSPFGGDLESLLGGFGSTDSLLSTRCE